MRYYSDEQIGETRARTPEGYLICSDVPIARTGVQKYDARDIPEISSLPDGTVDMERPEREVFSKAAIASFEGKPVTNDHPDEGMVSSSNHRELSVGHVQNVRRGTGEQSQLLLADMFITDPQAIRDIEDGKVEVSCGYDHDVEVIGTGKGRQKNIIGNHVALVDQGRCGPRCAIGDRAMVNRSNSLSSLLRRAFRAKDAKELEKIEDEAEGIIAEPVDAAPGENAVHIHLPGEDRAGRRDESEEEKGEDKTRMDKLEEKLDKVCDAVGRLIDGSRRRRDRRDEGEFDPALMGDDMDPELDEQDPLMEDERREEEDRRGRDEFGEAPSNRSGKKILGELEFTNPLGDRARSRSGRRDRALDGTRHTARDSAALEEDFINLLADAEVIVPGIRLPTFDAKQSAKTTVDRMCAFRRRVIDAALKDEEIAATVVDVNGGVAPNLRIASCDSVRVMFSATAAMRRDVSGIRAPGKMTRRSRDGNLTVPQQMQKANQDFWAKHGVQS